MLHVTFRSDSTHCEFQECQTQRNPSSFVILADITLASEAPTNGTSLSQCLHHSSDRASTVIITTLQQIINVSWTQEGSNIAKLSRWMRCLFTLALSNNAETAEQLLEQAINIIEKSHSSVSNPHSQPLLQTVLPNSFP